MGRKHRNKMDSAKCPCRQQQASDNSTRDRWPKFTWSWEQVSAGKWEVLVV